MTPGEAFWRGRRLVRDWVPRRDLADQPTARLLRPGTSWAKLGREFREVRGRPLLLDRDRALVIAAQDPARAAGLLAAAERIREGYVTYFGYPEVRLRPEIDWNHDPLHDFHWPARDAKRIDHRTAGADPKWIWELNRLQHLPLLAQAWLGTGDDSFAELAMDHLDSWMEQNPVGRGIAWRGSFEAGIRAISVTVALQGLRDSRALTADRLERSVRMLAASADLCWRDRSLFSSANNHLVGELTGLVTVAMMFPELSAAARWEERGLRAIEAEADRQILPDGSGAEQAVGYQVFTTELLVVVATLLTSRGDVVPSSLRAAIDRSADHLAGVVGDTDPDPRHGDDDEGFAWRLGPEERPTVRRHLAVVAALTGNASAARAGETALAARWVAAVTGIMSFDQAPGPGSMAALDGGLVVLRTGARRLTVDVGPLGYLSIAAHGHADALAVAISLDGRDLIGDPGAASYYGHPEWREVHRGTRVHATVTVDGEDQSVSGGPFLWTRHAQVRRHMVDLGRGVVDAEHDGYCRFHEPVTHRRWLVAPPDDATVLIVDEISGSGQHEMRASWPLHPEVDVMRMDHGYVMTRGGSPVAQLAMGGTGAVVLDHVRGDDHDHLGWWSNRLESRCPSWLVGARTVGVPPLVIATVVNLSGESDAAVPEPVVSVVGETITTSWTRRGQSRVVSIDRSGPGLVDLHRVPGGEVAAP